VARSRGNNAYQETQGRIQGGEHQDEEADDQEEGEEAVGSNKNQTEEAGETWEK
jgi:hypothetical protein